MAEAKFNEHGERIHNLPWVTIDYGNESVRLDYFDTWVRRYKDDPQFNHIDWMNTEGRCLKMVLPPESVSKMVDLGFRQTVEIIPSTEVEEWYVAYVLHDVDMEPTFPKEWTL